MWKHLIIDNFLKPEHFEYINNTFDTQIPEHRKNKPSAHSYLVNEKKLKQLNRFLGNIKTDKFSDSFIRELYNTYNPKLLDILREVAPEKVKLYKQSVMIFTVTPKNSSYPKHTDTNEKLLSVVIYLKPEKNTGTILYENREDKKPHSIVEWKPNRALIFSRSENTWHAYKGDGINDRYVLVYNLLGPWGMEKTNQ